MEAYKDHINIEIKEYWFVLVNFCFVICYTKFIKQIVTQTNLI